MKQYPNISFVAGNLAVLFYLAFAGLAFIQYPMPYSPMNNWLSDLGNVRLNPGGAAFYNIGIVSTALLLIFFFLGLSKWKIENNRVQVIMLLLTQAFGILGSICMVMSALYPINFFETHSFWSTSLWILLSTAFAFSVAMLRYHQNIPGWLLILGISTALMVILTSFLTTVAMLEWISLILFLSYVSLLGLKTRIL